MTGCGILSRLEASLSGSGAKQIADQSQAIVLVAAVACRKNNIAVQVEVEHNLLTETLNARRFSVRDFHSVQSAPMTGAWSRLESWLMAGRGKIFTPKIGCDFAHSSTIQSKNGKRPRVCDCSRGG